MTVTPPGRDSGLRVVQRVVFPGDDLDVVPLYVETNPDRGAAELAAELTTEELTGFKPSSVEAGVGAVGDAQSIIRFGADVSAHPSEDAGPRRSAVISPDRRVSFGTYFNAFPASYWRRWTTVSVGDPAGPAGGRVNDRPVPLHRPGSLPPDRDDQRREPASR